MNTSTMGNTIKSAWQRPKVSRIDIKKTLAGGGSALDGNGFNPGSN